jgi:hypothetical protein
MEFGLGDSVKESAGVNYIMFNPYLQANVASNATMYFAYKLKVTTQPDTSMAGDLTKDGSNNYIELGFKWSF